MADGSQPPTLHTPKVVFIRIGKDKSKGILQAEILKQVRKALRKSNDADNVRTKDKNCVSLSDLDAREIREVAVGPEYIGVLLKNGRVCRLRCMSSNSQPSERHPKRKSSPDESCFQVQSDEAFARRLQEQLNNTSATPSGLSASRFDEPYVGPLRTSLSDVSASGIIFDSLLPRFGRESREAASSDPGPTASTNAAEPSRGSRERRPLRSERTISPNRERSESTSARARPSTSVGISDSQRTETGRTVASSSNTLPPSSQPRNESSVPSISSSTVRISDVNSPSLARRATSQIVLPSTLYGNEFPVLRMVRPLVFPHNVMVHPRIIPVASIDASHLRELHATRARPFQASSYLRRPFVASSSSSYERNAGLGDSRSENGNQEENVTEFSYPQPGKLEWLEAQSGEELLFTHIASMHSEFVLVQRGSGTLYSWPYTTDDTLTPVQEPGVQVASSSSKCPDATPDATPCASPHPLVGDLGLTSDCVSLIATSSIRCTVVTAKGHVATFYDKLLRESCEDREPPALIQELSHSARSFTELTGEKVTGVDCSDFFSCVRTQSGRVFWWGLLPQEERQDFRVKLNKASSDSCNIAVRDKVQLKRHLPGFPGALVYKSNDLEGPLVGRLAGHEERDGTSSVVTKIKVEVCRSKRNNLGQKPASVVPPSVRSESDFLTSTAVGSPRSRMLESERQSSSTREPFDTDIWDVSDVVFLESESKVLGEVAAIDGPHVIVRVPSPTSPSKTCLRVFKVSELETVQEDGSGSSATPPRMSGSLYRGCIQRRLRCILDSQAPASRPGKDVLSGLKPIAMTAMQSGISLLVERLSDGKAFYLGPITSPVNKVYTCSADASSSAARDEGSFTVEPESVPVNETALLQAQRPVSEPSVGQKRKHADEDSIRGSAVASSKFDHSGHKFPRLQAIGDSGVVLLFDSNGCLFPRPYDTKLSSPCHRQLAPLRFMGTGFRHVPSVVAEKSAERMIAVVVAFEQQRLIPVIQSGVVPRVASVLSALEALNSQKDAGKGDKSLVKGRGKKVLVTEQDRHRGATVPVPKPVVTSSAGTGVNRHVLRVLHERCSSNQNVLHVCCSNPAFAVDLERAEIGKLLEPRSQGLTSEEAGGDPEIEVAVLDMLLTHETFAPEIVPMLKDRDANGCTPFMVAIQSTNIKAALYILNFVEQRTDSTTPGMGCSLEEMIFPAAFTGVSPLHALAIACTENLPPSGLGTSLLVSNLPSNYTPRILLKLFQGRYPSAYRASIPPLIERKKKRRPKTTRQRLLELTQKGRERKVSKKAEAKKTSLSTGAATVQPPRARRYNDTAGRIPTLTSRRESIQGMVTFGDAKEMRQALVEMDKHMVSSEMASSEAGMASLVQHVLYVKLAEVQNEEPEKAQMDVGFRGVTYSVSNVGGTTQISRKSPADDQADNKHAELEDKLVCQLCSRLLSYPQMATSVNKEGETALAFLINNSRWIRFTAQQRLRLAKYSTRMCGADAAKQDLRAGDKKRDVLIQEIKAPSTADASSIETNLIEQLDDISQTFRNLVDTLSELEERCSATEEVESDQSVADVQMDSVESVPVENLMDVSECPASTSSVQEEPTDDTLPVLIQLAQCWPCVAAVILGAFPEMEGRSQGGHAGGASGGRSTPAPAGMVPGDSCNLDAFVFELVTHASEAVLMRFVETIIRELNKHRAGLTLEAVLQSREPGPWTDRKLALAVGLRFVRAVVRQMAVHLSRSGLSYVDLRSRIVAGSASSRSVQNADMEFKRKVRMILQAFSWLAVHELVEAAEAAILPIREGVAKPQAPSTGASAGSAVPHPLAMFPGARFRTRPGIRVSSAHEAASRSSNPKLRTAYRLTEERAVLGTPRLRGIRLASIADDAAVSSKMKTSATKHVAPPARAARKHPRRPSTMVDSDSESDDESEGVLGLDSDDMDIDEADSDDVTMATGIGRDHPFAWALDGRLAVLTEGGSTPGHVHVRLAAHYASSVTSPPSVHTGNCYLARMFSRLVKEATDLVKSAAPDSSSSANGVSADELVLPVLQAFVEESASLLSVVSAKLEKSWRWLAGILDIVEGQLQMGRTFDTKRYLASLQRAEESELSFLTRSTPPVSGASPEEYLMFLLRAHNHEHSDSLPVMDVLCYEHTVYVLDAFIYTMNHWPKLPTDRNRNLPSLDGEEPIPSSSQSAQAEAGTPLSQPGYKNVIEKKRRRNLSKNSEILVKFFDMDVGGSEKERFLNSLRDAVQHKFPKVPKATWEVFTHNVSVSRQKSCDDTAHARRTGGDEEPVLPVTHTDLSSISYPVCLAQDWNPDLVLSRWKISVDLFSRMFLADGPGAERDSFLAARAGVAGRLARFRRTVSHLRETLTNDAQQASLGFGGLGGRAGTTLSLSIKRTQILEDALRILGEMTTFHYCNFRVKFEGEEGSGPGVNRGFFAAVANSLKAEDKFSEGSSLLHEPGKLPEQSGFYAPKPFSGSGTAEEISEAKRRRYKMFTAIGRFIGISLWFNNTVPLNFSRHVIKYLLDRHVTWEDLAFFNADLFEGLSRMMLDAEHPIMSSECFQATYCCHFETTVGGTTEELIPSGSQIAVTPENIHTYVSLYASKVMVGCVEHDLKAMSTGLHDVIPAELLTSLTPEDFQLLLSGGTTDVDINRLRSVISFTNSNGCSVDILERFKRWFWSTVQKMTPLQRQQLLYFCTGSAVLPALSDRKDADQDLSITIDVISGNTKALPMATTCGQRMSIPLYPSKKVLKRKLLQAIQCQSYGLG